MVSTFKEIKSLEKDLAAWEATFDVKTLTGNWSDFNTSFDTARNNIDFMQEITDAWAVTEQASLKKTVQGILTSLMVVFIFIIIVLFALTVVVVESIIRPVKAVSGQLGEIADGNLLVELPADEDIGKDELGDMQRSTKNLAEKLGAIIGKSKRAAQEVDNQSRELADFLKKETLRQLLNEDIPNVEIIDSDSY